MILLFPSLVHLKTDEAKAKFKPRWVYPVLLGPMSLLLVTAC